MEINELSGRVIGAAIEVHRELGPGLLESVYHRCLEYELRCVGLDVQSEVTLPIKYKSLSFESVYRADLVVENVLVIELKVVEQVLPVHRSQLLSYLKMGEFRLGLLINFNVPKLISGIKRIINNSEPL